MHYLNLNWSQPVISLDNSAVLQVWSRSLCFQDGDRDVAAINFHLKTVKHHAPMFTLLNIYSLLIVQKRHIFKGSSCNFSSVNCTPAAKCSSESFIADARSETLNCRLLRTVHWSNGIFCLCFFFHNIKSPCFAQKTSHHPSVYVKIFTYSNYGLIIL